MIYQELMPADHVLCKLSARGKSKQVTAPDLVALFSYRNFDFFAGFGCFKGHE